MATNRKFLRNEPYCKSATFGDFPDTLPDGCIEQNLEEYLNDTKPFFTADEFECSCPEEGSPEWTHLNKNAYRSGHYEWCPAHEAADIANAKFREWLEKQPVALNWIEQNRQGFYGGCRMDDHSPQINEFCAALEYYMKKDFGPKAKLVAIEELK